MTKTILSTGIHNDLPGRPELVTYTDGSTVPAIQHRASVAADRAIARSVSHTEIVTIDWSAELETELESRCDDSGGGGHSGAPLEFWGTDDDNEEWRVHLARETKSEPF